MGISVGCVHFIIHTHKPYLLYCRFCLQACLKYFVGAEERMTVHGVFGRQSVERSRCHNCLANSGHFVFSLMGYSADIWLRIDGPVKIHSQYLACLLHSYGKDSIVTGIYLGNGELNLNCGFLQLLHCWYILVIVQ